MSILNPIRRAFAPAIGSKWVMDLNNPWTEWVYIVEDVKGGYVKYRATTPRDGYVAPDFSTMDIIGFRFCYSRFDTPSHP